MRLPPLCLGPGVACGGPGSPTRFVERLAFWDPIRRQLLVYGGQGKNEAGEPDSKAPSDFWALQVREFPSW